MMAYGFVEIDGFQLSTTNDPNGIIECRLQGNPKNIWPILNDCFKQKVIDAITGDNA